MIRDWRVVGSDETLSDHRYIRFGVLDPSRGMADSPEIVRARTNRHSPRWATRKMDSDSLRASALVKAWSERPLGGMRDAETGTMELRKAVTEVCDVAMPRIKSPPPNRKAAYWWSEDLAALRKRCNKARRKLTRYRRRAYTCEEEEAVLRSIYKQQKAALNLAIRRAKAKAWDELLESVDGDPWGRPYLLVRKKLSSGGVPTTERLRPDFLVTVVDKLFPREEVEMGDMRCELTRPVTRWSAAEHSVTADELRREVKKLRAKNTAPGPDGVSPKALALALASGLEGTALAVYNKCLETGRFPDIWKVAKMVLLPKEGKPEDSASAYRPICLLDEAGKLMERVIATRLRRHLAEEGPDLANCQFGFRERRSTVDAIARMRSLAEEATDRGERVLAVSLDIANAFNSLPWSCIRRALTYHRVPSYLRDVIDNYLDNRFVEYRGRYGKVVRREVDRGVPQIGPRTALVEPRI